MQRWLLARPRFGLHFTPAYSSWINQVERWFAELQRRCLERGVFCSLEELTTALEEWIKLWNEAVRLALRRDDGRVGEFSAGGGRGRWR